MKSWNRIQLYLDPLFCIEWAFLILLLPFRWLMGWFLAAMWHEICHIVAVYAVGGHIYSLSIGPTGARMEATAMCAWKECFCIMAGPTGGLLALLSARWMPELALCALGFSLFNFLPVYPLDGGRALQCCLRGLWPDRHRRVERWVQWGSMGVLAAVGIWGARFYGFWVALFLGLLCLRLIQIKKPCKPAHLRVQ